MNKKGVGKLQFSKKNTKGVGKMKLFKKNKTNLSKRRSKKNKTNLLMRRSKKSKKSGSKRQPKRNTKKKRRGGKNRLYFYRKRPHRRAGAVTEKEAKHISNNEKEVDESHRLLRRRHAVN